MNSCNRRGALSHQRGFSLIELTVVLVILGIIGVLVARWLSTTADQNNQALQRSLLLRADDALMGFAAIQSRLPCPDGNNDGLEDIDPGSGNCLSATAVGTFPYRTLGLPDSRAARIRYGVLRRSQNLTLPEWGTTTSVPALNADLAVLTPRAQQLQIIGNSPTAAPMHNVEAWDNCSRLPAGTCSDYPQVALNSLDFCDGLRNAALMPTDTRFVHTLRELAPTAAAANVAYALVLPGNSPAVANHAGTSVAFHSPRQPSSTDYQDRVLAVGIDQLWTRLRCGDNYGPANYAHPNVAMAARLTSPAMHNYAEQLEIMHDLGVANDYSATAALILATDSLTDATGTILDTIGETFETYGIWNWRVGVATAGLGSAVGSIIAAGVSKGSANEYKNVSGNLRTDFKAYYPGAADALDEQIVGDARRSAMLGSFPDSDARRIAKNFAFSR